LIRLGVDVLESGANLLQDGTAHLWEERTHLTGVFVHLTECFLLLLDQSKLFLLPGLLCIRNRMRLVYSSIPSYQANSCHSFHLSRRCSVSVEASAWTASAACQSPSLSSTKQGRLIWGRNPKFLSLRNLGFGATMQAVEVFK
jgi:hypothetical protein